MINNSYGYTFPDIIKLIGFLLLGVGLLIIISQCISYLDGFTIVYNSLFFFLLSSGLLFIGLTMITTAEGVLIDSKYKRVMKYRSVLGLKYGGWISYRNFDQICFVYKCYQNKYSPDNQMINFVTVDICLLSKIHKKRIIIDTLRNKKVAKQKILILSKELGLPIKKIHPQFIG